MGSSELTVSKGSRFCRSADNILHAVAPISIEPMVPMAPDVVPSELQWQTLAEVSESEDIWQDQCQDAVCWLPEDCDIFESTAPNSKRHKAPCQARQRDRRRTAEARKQSLRQLPRPQYSNRWPSLIACMLQSSKSEFSRKQQWRPRQVKSDGKERSRRQWEKAALADAGFGQSISDRLEGLSKLDQFRLQWAPALPCKDPTPARACSPGSMENARFGMDFWRLPLPLLGESADRGVQRLADAAGQWGLLMVAALRLAGGSAAGMRLRKQSRIPAAVSVRRWQHLHGAEAQMSEQRRAMLLHQSRPHVLTLDYQCQCAALTNDRDRANRLQKHWRVFLMRMYCRKSQEMLRSARGVLMRTKKWSELPTTSSLWNPSWTSHSRLLEEPSFLGSAEHHFEASKLDPSQLGLDESTCRLLRDLENREITPEDYDLLTILDVHNDHATLNSTQLSCFPVGIYKPTSPKVLQVPREGHTAQFEFGIDFWRLPLIDSEVVGKTCASPESLPVSNGVATAQFGIDFWRLPRAETKVDGDACAGELVNCTCGVCLADLEAGDVIRTLLPCGHRFHQSCIDHWLLECSTVCPVDKHDLR